MQVINTPISPYVQNAPIAYCEESQKCIFIDPGDEIDKLIQVQKNLNLTPEYIFITHGHIDHAGAAKELADKLNLDIIGPHKDDKFLLDSLAEQGKMFGLNSKDCSPDVWLNEGDIVTIGKEKLETYFCPGHTPGHLIFYNLESKLAIVGDVLFCGSIGRTDLPGGNFDDLIQSVKDKLWPLGRDIEFIPGHGPMSTFEAERQSNPFVSDAVLGLS